MDGTEVPEVPAEIGHRPKGRAGISPRDSLRVPPPPREGEEKKNTCTYIIGPMVVPAGWFCLTGQGSIQIPARRKVSLVSEKSPELDGWMDGWLGRGQK